ncbi:MAG: LPS export ABC transporter periplasmic protein LptC [Pseudomonadaceae bacterium]|nr:LPS export ABC transporter periplasmic protein LptC [Pseudomonadaceae bacterium]
MWRWAGITFGVVLVAGLLWQLFGQSSTDRAEDPSQMDTLIESEPDIYGHGVTFTQLRNDGSLQYELNASAIRQFQDNGLTSMVSPSLKVHNSEQPPWDIRSNHGYIRGAQGEGENREEVVYLREDVLLEQNNPERGFITMRSEAMYFYPDRQYAETDQGVMIDTQVGRTRAAGMQAYLDTGLLNLMSNKTQRVHTIVLPEQFKKSAG